jgi:hypothetical protein
MIAYIDTCTILNLIKVNYDDEYINHLIKSFDEIKLTPKVFEELGNNKYDNIIDKSNKDTLDDLILRMKSYVDKEDCKETLSFTKSKNRSCFKDNGESHSISFALSQSRYGKVIGEKLLKTHFITDDEPAKADFSYYYGINLVGKIFDSIDLLTLFWIKGYIEKNQLIRYCHSLKSLYNKDVGLLLRKIQTFKDQQNRSLSSQINIVLTKLIELLSDLKVDTNEKLSDLTKNPDFKKLIRRKQTWKVLLNNIQTSNFREKIPYIEKRINDLDKVWV